MHDAFDNPTAVTVDQDFVLVNEEFQTVAFSG